jgi:hypothetical protein
MATAATKWKEFKAELKKAFMAKYHDEMEEDELLALCDERVHDIDWKWLIDHRRSPEATVSYTLTLFPFIQCILNINTETLHDRLVH